MSQSNSDQFKNLLLANHVSKVVSSGGEPLQILTDINLSIQHAESIAICGASGSGKSTLIALLAGLDLPSAGEIILYDHLITELNEDQRAKLRAQYIGYVFQSFYLLPNLTALENVLLPLELNSQKQAIEHAKSLLGEVGLDKRQHHYPNQLSGGEQQRVAIARAFACQPSLLFADEPTGNLDTASSKHIIELLFRLNQQHRTTLVLVTHDQSIAERCKRKVVMENGQLISSY